MIAGDPAAVAEQARALRAAAVGLGAAAASVTAHGRTITSEWTGSTSDAAGDSIEFLGTRTRVGGDVCQDAAVVLEGYAAELRVAQQAYAAAAAAHVVATAQQAEVRQALQALPPTAHDDPDHDLLLQRAGASVTAAAQDMAAAKEHERVASEVAAHLMGTLTAELAAMTARPPAPPPPPPAEDEGGWSFGQFFDGVRDGVVEPVAFAGGLVGLNGDVTDNWVSLGRGVRHGATNPGDFVKAAVNWEDLSEGNYAHWGGELLPSVAAAFATGGAAAGVKGADALTGVSGSAKALDGMSDVEKASLLARGADLDGQGGAGPRLDYSQRFQGELRNFRGPYLSGTRVLEQDLWLVDVHDRSKDLGAGRSLRWAAPLDEVLNDSRRGYVRRLALPSTWGPRDGMTLLRIPAGTEVTLAEGVARHQFTRRTLTLREHSLQVPVGLKLGGGQQVLLSEVDPSWVRWSGDAPWPPGWEVPGGAATGAAGGLLASRAHDLVEDRDGSGR